MNSYLSMSLSSRCLFPLACLSVMIGLTACGDDSLTDPAAGSHHTQWPSGPAAAAARSGPALAPKVLDPSTSDKRPIGYTDLLLADEFGGTELDRTKWCTRLMWGGSENTPPLQVPDVDCVGWGAGVLDFVNDELHRFRDFDAQGQTLHAVSNGMLQLRATVKSSDPTDMQFESAVIRGKQLLLPDANKSYYVTGRYRLPDALGSLPQTWLAPSLEPAGVAQWPPEIDIFEGPINFIDTAEDLYQLTQVRSQQTSTGARRMFSAAANYDQQYGLITEATSLRQIWLEIGAEWTRDSVCFYVDGKRSVCDYYRWVSNNGIQGNPATLLVNMAVGGGWAGRDGIDLSKFPISLDVDYIRIYERTHRALSGRAGDITAAATLSGQQPQPTKFPNSTAYYAVNTKRLDGGAIQASTSGAWSLHSIDAGNPQANPHLFTFEDLSGTTGLGVNFAGLESTNASHTGSAAGSGYSVQLTRPDSAAAWDVKLVRNDGVGTTPVALQSQAAALPSSTIDAAIRVDIAGSQVSAVVTGDSGAQINLAASDTTHRGNWVGAEVFPSTGLGPLIVEAFGLDVLPPAVIPGPTPGQAPTIPEVTYPSAASTLFGSSQIFYWWGANVSQWWLYAGSTPGGNQYYDSGPLASTIGAATGRTVATGLPLNGSTVYVTLFYRDQSGDWQSVASTYSAAGSAPSITSPLAGSTLSGASQTFEWTGSGVNNWWLYAGSNAGGNQYFDSGDLAQATNATVTGLPVDGSTVHLRLYYQYPGSTWQYTDSTYTAFTSAMPEIVAPVPGATLSASSMTLIWTGEGVAQWWVYAGSSEGGNQYFDSGALDTSTSVEVTGLPSNGSPVHVRLWYRYPAGTWQTVDAIYMAAGTAPSMVAPLPGTDISGASSLFEWTAPSGVADQWWLYVGSTPNSNDYFDSQSLGASNTVMVTGLPANGSTVFTTLWYRLGTGVWQSVTQQNMSVP